MQKVKDFLEQMRNMRFTSTGYKSLDVLTNGLMRGGVTLIAARPAMGKFSFVLNMVSRLSQQITGDVLIFSPRFRETEVTIRLLEIGTGLKAAEFFNGSLSTENLRNKCTDYFNSQLSRIQIEDLISPSLEDVQWYSNRVPDLRLLVVDYIERIDEPFEVRKDCSCWEKSYEPKDKSLRFLKKMALDLDVPVLCTTCLHRSLERRKDKRPKLSDLTKTDVTEYLADQIIFLHRDQYYDPFGKAGTELIVAKNNCGATGTVKLNWDDETFRFDEIPDN